MILPKSNDTELKQLLNDVNQGKIQLPEFQRDWTWDDHRIRGIIASLSEGYPMGAIMQLQYGNPDIRFKYRTLTGVRGVSNEPDYLILDGQQRLTSIFQATFSKEAVSTKTDKGKKIRRYYYLSMEKCLDTTEDRFDAVLSVPEDRKLKENFDRDVKLDLSSREQEYIHKYFPVNIVFDSSSTMDWFMGYLQFYNMDPHLMDEFKRFQSEILNVISGSKLPVITLDKSTPREAVCKVFENVNTGGVPLTVFELVTATYATQEFDLRKDWIRARNIIRCTEDTLRTDLFDGIDETNYLTTITLYSSYMKKVEGKTGSVSCKKKDVLNLPFNDYIKYRDNVLDGYLIAREFLLKYQYVFRQRDLPYSTQLIPLSAICAYLGKKKCNEPKTISILSKWYWCGIMGEMYGGANETRYANDIEDVVDEINGKSSLQRTVNASFFSSTRLLTLQTRLSAAYKGIMALLYKNKCRDFKNNITIDVVNSMMSAPDIHHIFPEAYCKKVNIPRQKYNSIVNKTPILLETNRFIGGHAPSKYLESLLLKVEGLSEDELRNRVESHLIDFNFLVKDDFDHYFIDRSKKLLTLIENAMGKTISDKGSEETINQFGVTLE